MLITLWARAEESRHPEALLRDPTAEVLRERIAYDFERFRGGWKTVVGVAVRARVIDRIVRERLHGHPGATVVALGAGLDARLDRLDDGRVRWFNLDLAPAIAFRRAMLGAEPRGRSVAASLLDDAWWEEIDPGPGAAPPLFVAEGVLMYLPRAEVAGWIDRLARRFPGGGLVFDAIGGLMVRAPWLHDTILRASRPVRFAWGLRSLAEPESWSSRCRIREACPLLTVAPDRWRWMAPLARIPVLRRQFAVVHLEFTAP